MRDATNSEGTIITLLLEARWMASECNRSTTECKTVTDDIVLLGLSQQTSRWSEVVARNESAMIGCCMQLTKPMREAIE